MKKWLILALALLFLSGCSFSKVRDWFEEMEWERDDETVSIVHSTIVAWGSDKCGLRTAAEPLNRCRIDTSIETISGPLRPCESQRKPDSTTVLLRASPWGA